MNKQISEFTVEELKSMGFDLVKQFEIVQGNLKLINEELQRREIEAKKPISETKKK